MIEVRLGAYNTSVDDLPDLYQQLDVVGDVIELKAHYLGVTQQLKMTRIGGESKLNFVRRVELEWYTLTADLLDY